MQFIQRLFLSLSLGGFLPSLLLAQANVPSSPDEEVVELSPFTIEEGRDLGYFANNTLSGTRLNSNLRDTPATISVFNAEFIADTGFTDTNALIEYSVTFSQDTTANNGNAFQSQDLNLRARGFAGSNFASRDFFSWFISSDSYNTTRFEFSHGPNSILFGTGSPGGVINTVTKRAVFRDLNELEFRFDNFGTFRAALDVNRSLIDEKLALRVNLLREDEKTNRDNEFEDQLRAHIALTYRPLENTTIRVDYERGTVERLKQRRWTIRDGFSTWEAAGSQVLDYANFTNPNGTLNTTAARNFVTAAGGSFAQNPTLVFFDDGNQRTFVNTQFRAGSAGDNRMLQDFSIWDQDSGMAGPVNRSDYDFHSYSAFVEQRIGKEFFVELAYNRQAEDRDFRHLVNHGSIRAHRDITRTLPNGSPNPDFGRWYMESFNQWGPSSRDGDTMRATASYQFDTGSPWFGRHQLAALWQDEQLEGRSRRIILANRTPLNAAQNAVNQNQIAGRTYIHGAGEPGANGFQFDPVGNPVGGTFPITNPITGAQIGTLTPDLVTDRDRPNRNTTESFMVAGQSFFLGNRLAATWGWRRDTLAQQTFEETLATNADVAANPGLLRNEILGTRLTSPQEFVGETATYGVVVTPVHWLSLTANFSQNFLPQSSRDLFNENIGNIDGEGQDYSLRVGLPNGKLYASVTYFETEALNSSSNAFNTFNRINDIWRTLEARGLDNAPAYVIEGAHDVENLKADGFEFEVIANPTEKLTLRANFAIGNNITNDVNPGTRRYLETYLDRWTPHRTVELIDIAGLTVGDRIDLLTGASANDRLAEGEQAEGHVPLRANFFAKYAFREGPLKKFDVGFGARYRDASYTGYYNLDGVKREARGTEYTLFDLKVGYRTRVWNDKVRLNLSFNVFNLFDEDSPIQTEAGNAGEPNDYVLQPPRRFQLTANFAF